MTGERENPEGARPRWLSLLLAGMKGELGTEVGRINFFGMVLVLLASGLVSSLGFFQAAVRVFRPNYSTGVPGFNYLYSSLR